MIKTNNFTKRTVSPFRADVVGSFLRPTELKQARADFSQGQITASQLKQVEDQAISELLAKEEEAGLQAVTDGEFRRSWWHLDFFWGFQGIQKKQAQTGYLFHDETTRAETVELTRPLTGENHPFVEHFQFTRDHASSQVQVKQTIPAPAQFLAELQRPENRANVAQYYPNDQELTAAIVKSYQKVIQDLYQAGLQTLQLDDCTWGSLADRGAHPKHQPNYGLQPEEVPAAKEEFVALNNAVLTGLPTDLTVNTHICRGNYHSTWANTGGYDFVADPLFTKEKVQAYYLEYDSQRAGDFTPLAQIRRNQLVVLGLVTSKSGTLETPDQLVARIEEASQYVDLDRLCLSPQCGFASTEEGNILTEDQQWKKIELIKKVAQQVWG
ncbi:5-methyltetrahydropteroyltriglutamate--homocysteine S-methyltransferase [Lactobacillus sp. DCY120]|uniref:5-methyltetrahydropteroyltriglutamate--homocysteine S-methyltransferase n=1 Tax=Bombilactobacillus apium TaxID=2675299 RepID=A0A850QZA5_9LACO|nr:5-methyltetrahydropteroyltriglutamate--homocysteine S-methyltransferase [Bombilactobacillus apium]NVY96023.1 5-methyltetrahydropteroyltriglutamate--homocysteine S-methyltransferase [Bombilactobacillus apium]